jgi:RpiB/LacA/LacB family sugar-phosphate isomerase
MIYLGADHAGYKLKEKIKIYFDKHNVSYADLGAEEYDKDDDYPDYAKLVAKKVSESKDVRGILICGSGNGMAITANKVKKVRAAVAWNINTAKMSVKDDHANILVLGARELNSFKAKKIVKTWLSSEPSKAKRHVRRVRKIEG